MFTEIIMQIFGRSICVAEGCKIAAQHARYGDISLLLIGLATFSLLTVFSILNRRHNKALPELCINYLLIVSLACEGFFIGYQVFHIHTTCFFCLIIFGLLVILGIIRLLAGEKELIAGFASLTAVFSLLYLVLPTGASVNLPENERLILFYSKDCKHCSEVITELEEKKITVKHLEVNGYAGLLKNLGIVDVPTLLVNDPYQKVFLTGKNAISRYLTACAGVKKEAETPVTKKISGKERDPSKMIDTGMSLDIFTQNDIFSRPGETAPAAGLCKEDEICK